MLIMYIIFLKGVYSYKEQNELINVMEENGKEKNVE